MGLPERRQLYLESRRVALIKQTRDCVCLGRQCELGCWVIGGKLTQRITCLRPPALLVKRIGLIKREFLGAWMAGVLGLPGLSGDVKCIVIARK